MSVSEAKWWEEAKRYPEFSKGDVEVFVETYKSFDQDGNGVIDKTELAAVLKSMGQGSSSRDIELLVDRYGKGKDYIDFSGFLEMMRYFYPWKRVQFVRDFVEPSQEFPEFTRNDLDVFLDIYREFDEDESGTIDIYELGKMFKAMGQGCSQERLNQVINQFGKGGVIDWTGFLSIMRSFYPEKRRQYEKKYHVPAKNFPEFTRAEVDVFVRTFREFDLDGNGSIDIDELGLMFKKMGQGYSKDMLVSLMDQYDVDGNGTVEWPEFLGIMRSFYPHKLAEFESEYYEPAKKFTEFSRDDISVFISAFRDFDVDGSGTIDIDELDRIFRSMGQGCPKEKLQQIIHDVDANGNGVVEWEEFLEIMRGLYNGRWSNQSKSSSTASKPAAASTAPSSGFKTASAPSPSSAPRSNVGIGSRSPSTPGSNKCVSCGKTVYSTEAINANGQIFHKICFKCMEPSCGITLNLKNFFGHGDKVYCSNHVPKSKPTQTTVEDSFATKSAISAPKLKMAAGVKKDARMTFAPGQLKPVNPDDPEQ